MRRPKPFKALQCAAHVRGRSAGVRRAPLGGPGYDQHVFALAFITMSLAGAGWTLLFDADLDNGMGNGKAYADGASYPVAARSTVVFQRVVGEPQEVSK